MAGGLGHEDFRPAVVEVAGAAGDPLDAITGVVLHVGGVAAVLVGVVFGAHVAAAAPALVADPEVLDLPGFLAAVFAAEVGQLGIGIGGHVFDPVHHLLGRAAADVTADVGLGADELAEVHELMGAKGV